MVTGCRPDCVGCWLGCTVQMLFIYYLFSVLWNQTFRLQYHHEKPFYSQIRKIKLWVHDTDNLIIIQSWVLIEWKLTSVARNVFFFSAFVRLLLILASILWRFLVFMMQRFHRAQVMKYFNRLISMFLLQYVAQYPEGTSIRTLKNSIFEAPFSVFGKRSISNESWTFQL